MGRSSDDALREKRRANRVRGTPDRQHGRSSPKSIREWLNQVRFKKALFGGVQEADVWKKISELNAMYENALAAERMRYDSLLEERAEVPAKQRYWRSASDDAEQEKAGDGKDK